MADPADLHAYPLLGSLEDGCELRSSEHISSLIWHLLPEHCLERVLLFLPARSICRLRLVCKQWRRLLSSGKFFQEKAKVAPLPPLICTLRHVDVKKKEGPPQHCLPITAPRPYRWDLSFIRKEFWDSIPKEKGMGAWSLDDFVDCVDGLLCITRKSARGLHMIVVNPATRTFRLLPKVPPAFHTRGLRSARLTLDEPFGTAFTLTWHVQVFKRVLTWIVGSYSSHTNTWTVCEDVVEKCWAGEDSEVCNGCFVQLVRLDFNSFNCVLYSFDTGRFVRTGQASTPRIAVKGLPRRGTYETEWSLLDHGGSMFLIAQVLVNPGQVMRGLEIWKLDLCSLKYEQVGTIPSVFIDLLLSSGGRTNSYPLTLKAMSSIGDYVCLVMSTDPETSRNVHADGELKHVLGFNVPNRSWQLLYEESEDENRLIPLPPGLSYKSRTILPAYPFINPNFHVFL